MENVSSKRLNMENGTLIYRIKQGKAVITGYQGFAASLVLPSVIEGYPVAVIDRKAFLSRKGLCSLRLPDSLEEVGDWAFAYCSSLRDVSFSGGDVRFGRAVFKDCKSLERIEVRDDISGGRNRRDAGEFPGAFPGMPGSGGGMQKVPCAELLAAVVTMLDADYLLNLSEAGSREWLEQWDIRFLSILRARDSEGYISQSVYGEEDYIGTDLEEFTSEKRRLKVRLCFLRLLHPRGLSLSGREELEQYLRSLTRGQGTGETWQVIREEQSGCREYYSLFAELGCITEDNFQGILLDIGEDSPEMKAFFLKYREEGREDRRDFFEGLDL